MIRGKHIIRAAMAGLAWMFIFYGCNVQTEPPPKPKIVRKKIVAPAKPAPVSSPKKTVKAADAAPQNIVEPKPVAPVAANADTPPPTIPPLPMAEKGASPVPIKPSPAVPPKPSKPPVVAISETAQKKLSAQDIPLYDAAGKIDPFVPLIKRQPEGLLPQKKMKKRIPRTPLEKMDFNQMKLVAILQSSKGPKALIEEASGKGYIISMGTYMGLNSGKVIQILKDRIVIEEVVENVLGESVARKRELKLQKPPGEF